MISIKVNGKTYKFKGNLEPEMSYVYHIEGHDIFITVSEKTFEYCKPLLDLSKVVNVWTHPEEETK